MIVGIDGDVLRYELGAVATDKDVIFDEVIERPWSTTKVHKLVDERVASIIERSGASEVEVYLTGAFNFRIALATIAPYKGNRVGDKPYHWETVSRRLIDRWNAKVVLGIEADDMLAIRCSETLFGEYIIASRDKDLRQVTGLHYSWQCGDSQPEKPTYEVNGAGFIDYKKVPSGGYSLTGHGYKFFYAQLLVGDGIDNIKGCPRMGPKKTVELLGGLDDEKELLEQCFFKYQQHYDDPKAALVENARLLYLIRDRSWLTEEKINDTETMYHLKQFWEYRDESNTEHEPTSSSGTDDRDSEEGTAGG